MIEIEYMWREVFKHLDAFQLGGTIVINKEEHRLVGMKMQVKRGANMFLKLTYVKHDEMKGVFGMELYDENFSGISE